jgi:hypothetical protein
VFLLPFVAIRLVSGDRQSGALKLEMQQGMPAFARIAVKGAVALAGWLIAMAPPLSAILLWKSYGGSLYAPEMAALVGGHVLNAALTIGLAVAAASIAENPSTAAILTLGVTVGTWIINFFGAIQGGWWERAAGYTPAAMVAEFQHGLVRLDTVLTGLVLVATGLAIAAIWMRLGVRVTRRATESVAACLVCAAVIFTCTFLRPSWDTSENRGNSFARSDERALRAIHQPLRIEVHLAPEDPRRIDLDHRALSKLRRIMPQLHVDYVSSTTIGLFEQTAAGYGEIRYYLGDKNTISRATTAEGVLEAIYALANVTPPKETADDIFRGHPLALHPAGAALVFYGVWPAVVLISGVLVRRQFR